METSKRLAEVILIAQQITHKKKHEYLSLESFLLGLLADNKIATALEDSGVDVNFLIDDLNYYLSEEDNFSVLDEHQLQALAIQQEKEVYFPSPTELVIQVLQQGHVFSQASGRPIVEPRDIMLGILRLADYGDNLQSSFAIKALLNSVDDQFYEDLAFTNDEEFLIGKKEALTLSFKEQISELTRNNSDLDYTPQVETTQKKVKKEGKFLPKYCKNLTTLAKEKKIDPLIGRGKELERIIHILGRKRKNNPILVGEAGVGKTALCDGLALLIAKDNVPKFLKDRDLHSLDMTSLMAGTKYRGDVEARLQGIIKEAKEDNAILFIDEIHTIIGAGSSNGSSQDVGNLLKPHLDRGELSVIGSTTYEEYSKHFDKEAALKRRFGKVDIKEPTEENCVKILEGIQSVFEKFHEVTFEKGTIEEAVKLSVKYMHDRRLPDKAIDVIDEAATLVKLNTEDKIVRIKDIDKVMAEMANIPAENVSKDEVEKLKSLEENLKLSIYGQDDAVQDVCKAIKIARAGLNNPNKPISIQFFVGPTGVGKTELAKQLKENLGLELLRYDMSECMEKHSVSKLIGSPPGYVGSDAGGRLTEDVKRHPSAIILLDEFEKAHEDIQKAFLQVFDYGKLTDGQGRTTDFRQTMIILTSNVGIANAEKRILGLGSQTGSAKQESYNGKIRAALGQAFSKEFINRLDKIVYFNKLNEENVMKVVDKFLTEIECRITDKNVSINVEPAASKWLAKEGFDEEMGARPLARIIDEKVMDILAEELLFGKLVNGGTVKIKMNKEGDDLEIVCRAKRKSKKKKEAEEVTE